MIPKLLTPFETSNLLHVEEGTLAIWRCTGRHNLPFTKIGHKVFYDEIDIEEFISKNKRTQTA